MDTPDTVTEALSLLREKGYDVEFQFVDGHFTCDAARCSTDDVEVEVAMRFEGLSDPGDEMIVFGLRDPATGTKGRFASAFGSSADPEVLEHLIGLDTRFRVSVGEDGRPGLGPA